MNNLKITFSIIILMGFTVSCKKYLDKKPDMVYYVPERWQDLQALLDNTLDMNLYSTVALPEVIGGDIYVADNIWKSASANLKDHYVWNSNARDLQSWSASYRTHIYISNVVLDNIRNVTNKNETFSVDNVEGSALFFRSLGFYNLSQLYCPPYNSATATTDLGLVLKLNGDIEEKKIRSSNAETYHQITSDLKKAFELLPSKSLTAVRPSKLAAKALLARVYLSMSDYENAEKYADEALSQYNSLLDYNSLLPTNNPLLPAFAQNPEIIFMCTLQNVSFTTSSNARVDLDLYKSFEANDLRKKIFFQANTGSRAGSYRFGGCYYGEFPNWVFNGLATDELYFIKMECLARKAKYQEAITLLNDFLKKRYVTGLAKVYFASNVQDALQAILLERRKELVFRGVRWSDIRRLNLSGANIVLKRQIEGVNYELLPNDLRYTLLIPEEEISRSGIKQNPR